ncbi:hypothetical protein HNY73_006670 [Argiope bruennichi]|uniref:Uncharacterized protein n=1 Tax=Argiope bruennichi TaxID=94029 RepID=A0A8T0FGQ7_ARGBR|nr:hypothetical protein HNY73_006670 [Argiope bruennichi]
MAETKEYVISNSVQASKAKPILIGIDNLEHVGTETWLFLQELLLTRVAVVIGTVTSEYNPSIPFVKSLIMQQFNSIIMRPLDEEELGLLACVVLNVKAINREFLPEGNALRLEEILMIPSLQKHFAILPYSNVSKKNLESKFLLNKDVPSKFVCDVVDSEAMENLQIPAHLLDVVRDHTTGLNPEEQMLIRKCALLGESFGLFVLEAVCPEYPTAEVGEVPVKISTIKMEQLCEKVISCEVSNDHESSFQNKGLGREWNEEKRAEKDKAERQNKKTQKGGKTENEQKERPGRPRAQTGGEGREKKKPRKGMRTREGAQRKEAGNRGKKGKQIDKILVKTKRLLVEGGLSAKINIDPSAVDFSSKAKEANPPSKQRRWPPVGQASPHGTIGDWCEIGRRSAHDIGQFALGKNNEAMREIKHALLLLNVLFPSDIEKNVNRHNWTDHPLAPEFIKCLQVGCAILKILGLYEIAYKSGKYHLTLLSKHGHSFVDIVKSKSLLLSIVWKTKPSRKRERQSTKLGNEIRQLCFKRLMEYPIVEIVELKTIISAFKTVLNMLFEKSELTAAEELGKKIFQLLILLKHEKELTRILSVLARIYFFQCKSQRKIPRQDQHLQRICGKDSSSANSSEIQGQNILPVREHVHVTLSSPKIKLIADPAHPYISSIVLKPVFLATSLIQDLSPLLCLIFRPAESIRRSEMAPYGRRRS